MKFPAYIFIPGTLCAFFIYSTSTEQNLTKIDISGEHPYTLATKSRDHRLRKTDQSKTHSTLSTSHSKEEAVHLLDNIKSNETYLARKKRTLQILDLLAENHPKAALELSIENKLDYQEWSIYLNAWALLEPNKALSWLQQEKDRSLSNKGIFEDWRNSSFIGEFAALLVEKNTSGAFSLFKEVDSTGRSEFISRVSTSMLESNTPLQNIYNQFDTLNLNESERFYLGEQLATTLLKNSRRDEIVGLLKKSGAKERSIHNTFINLIINSDKQRAEHTDWFLDQLQGDAREKASAEIERRLALR